MGRLSWIMRVGPKGSLSGLIRESVLISVLIRERLTGKMAK